MKRGCGPEQQENNQVFMQKEIFEHYDARAHDKQRREHKSNRGAHAERTHQVKQEAANCRTEDQVHDMKCYGIGIRENLQHNAGVEIESGRLHVQVVQAFEQAMPQQRRVQDLEEAPQGPDVEAHSQQVINHARQSENQAQQSVGPYFSRACCHGVADLSYDISHKHIDIKPVRAALNIYAGAGKEPRFMFRIKSCIGIMLCSSACFAAIGSVSVQSTPAQAVLSFTVSDPTQCLVDVYSDTARTQLVDDTNSTLFANSDRCNRAGSAIDGKNVTFVAGLRTSQKAADGKFHSRALAAVTTYYFTITDVLNFQTVQGSFTTTNPSLGNMYPEQPPFDPSAWDNRAYPQFTWTPGQRNQMLVDPSTGFLVKRMTFAGDAYAKGQNSTDGVGSPLATAITGSSACSSAANLNSSGTSFATCTGAAKIFLPLPAFQMIGSGVFNNWYPRFNVDDLLLYLYGSADSTAISAANGSDTVSVCLAQGVNLPCLSQQFSVQLLSTAGATGTAKVPANTPSPVFANWGYTPLHGDVVPTPGTVAVSGNTVSLTNPGQSSTY